MTEVDMCATIIAAHSQAPALAGPVMTTLAVMIVWLREMSDDAALAEFAGVTLDDGDIDVDARRDGDRR